MKNKEIILASVMFIMFLALVIYKSAKNKSKISWYLIVTLLVCYNFAVFLIRVLRWGMASLGILLVSLGVGLSIFMLLKRSIEYNSKSGVLLSVLITIIYSFILFVYYFKI